MVNCFNINTCFTNCNIQHITFQTHFYRENHDLNNLSLNWKQTQLAFHHFKHCLPSPLADKPLTGCGNQQGKPALLSQTFSQGIVDKRKFEGEWLKERIFFSKFLKTDLVSAPKFFSKTCVWLGESKMILSAIE